MKNTISVILALCLLAGCAHFSIVASGNGPIGMAVDRGAAYLKKAVSEDRHHLACRASDGSACPVDGTGHVFAAFFIARAIGDRLSDAEKQRITDRMDVEQRQGVWGYMPYAPVDADDTAFVLRTYRLLGRDAAAESLLRFYDKEAKAFTTFDRRGPAALTYEASVAGNFGLHPEVNANIFTLLAESPQAGLVNDELIVGAQDPQGWWRSYFYPGRYYGTAMSLGLLCKTEKGEGARTKGIAFLHASQQPDGSWGGAYATALALDALAACGVRDAAFARGISWLLGRQGPDGAWRDEETPLWEYTYSDRPKVLWRAYDRDGVVTTALAVAALRAARGGK
ncbi:MAG: hypothetical protein M0009_03555 [Deltaproteobacteria bacterium]|nr:hypothetical protein [Deltaproteobacteria bacterium]